MTMKPEGAVLAALQELENLRIRVGAEGVVCGLGVHQPGIDDDVPYYSLAIRTGVGVFSGSSPCIETCLRIAKGKHVRELDRLAALRKGAKAAKQRTLTHCDAMHQDVPHDE